MYIYTFRCPHKSLVSELGLSHHKLRFFLRKNAWKTHIYLLGMNLLDFSGSPVLVSFHCSGALLFCVLSSAHNTGLCSPLPISFLYSPRLWLCSCRSVALFVRKNSYMVENHARNGSHWWQGQIVRDTIVMMHWKCFTKGNSYSREIFACAISRSQ